MEELSFLIKPASGLCNMRCRYCFYEDETAVRASGNRGLMSRETAFRLIDETFSLLGDRGRVSFAFQGGEPTLAGLDYFRAFTQRVREKNTARLQVSYAIQTNALTLDGAWADFLRENRFLVGVSLDGEKAIHDALRPDAAGKGTWNRVTGNLALLQRKQVEVNLLCVVSRLCAKHPAKVYRSLQKLGGQYLQFIPCLDPLEGERGAMPYSLTPQLYGDFLCELFDLWYRDLTQGRYTSIRLFDDYVHLAMGLPPGTCSTSGSCGAYLVVEGDGSLYPCDFYCLDQWFLGRLGEVSLPDAMESRRAGDFLQEGLDRPASCDGCRWRSLCNGGCKRDWILEEGERRNYFCPAFRQFFAYAESRLWELARFFRMQGGS